MIQLFYEPATETQLRGVLENFGYRVLGTSTMDFGFDIVSTVFNVQCPCGDIEQACVTGASLRDWMSTIYSHTLSDLEKGRIGRKWLVPPFLWEKKPEEIFDEMWGLRHLWDMNEIRKVVGLPPKVILEDRDITYSKHIFLEWWERSKHDGPNSMWTAPQHKILWASNPAEFFYEESTVLKNPRAPKQVSRKEPPAYVALNKRDYNTKRRGP